MIFLLLSLKLNFYSCKDGKNQILNDLVKGLLQKYDRDDPPVLPGGSNLHHINLTVSVDNIYDISEHDSSFKINYILRLEWWDLRYKFQPIEMESGENISEVEVSIDRLKDRGKVISVSFIYLQFFCGH